MTHADEWFLMAFLILAMVGALAIIFVFTEAYPGEKALRKGKGGGDDAEGD